jgi:hypothetical protein
MSAQHRFTKFVGTAIAGTALGLAAFATAGTAAASSGDDAFLANISTEGIGYDSPGAAVANAHAVCGALAQGQSVGSIGNEILSNTNLTTRQAAAFVVAAVGTYCPGYQSVLTA